jgi:predicted RNA-binding Zn-ribbon protein involved in translation (DUF1610 family)
VPRFDDDWYEQGGPSDEDPDTEEESPDADLFEDDYDESPEYDAEPCPSCGALISDQAPKCPICGDWVVGRSDAARRSATWFWPIVIVLLLLGFILVFAGR